jgi:hypothetical protein
MGPFTALRHLVAKAIGVDLDEPPHVENFPGGEVLVIHKVYGGILPLYRWRLYHYDLHHYGMRVLFTGMAPSRHEASMAASGALMQHEALPAASATVIPFRPRRKPNG